MILTTQEISFIKENREVIKKILEKRKGDIIDAAIQIKDEKQKIKLLDLAEQFKDGIGIVENINNLKNTKKKNIKKNTGI